MLYRREDSDGDAIILSFGREGRDVVSPFVLFPGMRRRGCSLLTFPPCCRDNSCWGCPFPDWLTNDGLPNGCLSFVGTVESAMTDSGGSISVKSFLRVSL